MSAMLRAQPDAQTVTKLELTPFRLPLRHIGTSRRQYARPPTDCLHCQAARRFGDSRIGHNPCANDKRLLRDANPASASPIFPIILSYVNH